jgi:hypothetical protein
MTRTQSNNQWSGGIATHTRRNYFGVQKSAGKFLASFVWYQDGTILNDYFSKSQTINAEYYSYLQVQLKDILKDKRKGKFTNVVLFLHD